MKQSSAGRACAHEAESNAKVRIVGAELPDLFLEEEEPWVTGGSWKKSPATMSWMPPKGTSGLRRRMRATRSSMVNIWWCIIETGREETVSASGRMREQASGEGRTLVNDQDVRAEDPIVCGLHRLVGLWATKLPDVILGVRETLLVETIENVVNKGRALVSPPSWRESSPSERVHRRRSGIVVSRQGLQSSAETLGGDARRSRHKDSFVLLS